MPDPTTEEAISATQTKGDPNYRQGKKKKPKLTPKDRKKQVQANAPTPSPAETAPVRTRATLLASTEVDHLPAPSFSTPQKHQPILRDRSKDSSGSPPRTDRRKSVAFTPDTKRVDGDSGQTWFKKWAAEQKGEEGEVPEQPSFTSVPATVDEPKEIPKIEKKEKKKEKKDKASRKEQEAAAFAASAVAKEEQSIEKAPEPTKSAKESKEKPTPAPKGKKKDPSIYIDYLNQYYNDHDHWKFNKAKQNDVVDNALNIFRIPDEHSDALLEYIKGLKGAGVIERLREKPCRPSKNLTQKTPKRQQTWTRTLRKQPKKPRYMSGLSKRRSEEKSRVMSRPLPHTRTAMHTFVACAAVVRKRFCRHLVALHQSCQPPSRQQAFIPWPRPSRCKIGHARGSVEPIFRATRAALIAAATTAPVTTPTLAPTLSLKLTLALIQMMEVQVEAARNLTVLLLLKMEVTARVIRLYLQIVL